PFVSEVVEEDIPIGLIMGGGPAAGAPAGADAPQRPARHFDDGAAAQRAVDDTRPHQLGGGGAPDLGGVGDPDLGGGTFFPPDVPPRPIPPAGFTPNFPTPRPPGPTDPTGGSQFLAGWDMGNIGPGIIDIPLGTITPNST